MIFCIFSIFITKLCTIKKIILIKILTHVLEYSIDINVLNAKKKLIFFYTSQIMKTSILIVLLIAAWA